MFTKNSDHLELKIVRVIAFLITAVALVSQMEKAHAADRDELGEECYKLLHSEEVEESQATEESVDECLTYFHGVTHFIITLSRRPESLSEAAASVSVVPQGKIERAASDGVAEVLRDVPGINVTDSGQAGLKRISLRGEDARRVRILVDGQEFSDQREVGTPLLVAPELIERIEVVRGTGSILHGSRAIGGVVNVITKKEGYHPFQGTVSSSFDTATEGYQTLASAYGLVEGIGYRLAGTFAEHGDRGTPAGDLENTSFNNSSWNGYIVKEWSNHRLALSYDDYRSDSNVYVDPVVRTTPPFVDFRIDAPVRDRRKAAFFYEGKELSRSVKNVHFDGYYQSSKREFDTFSDLLLDFDGASVSSSSSIFTTSELDTLGTNGLVTLEVSDSHTLTTGFEAKNDELDQNRLRIVETAGREKEPEITIEGANQSSLELFGEDIWAFADDWEARGGARGVWVKTELDNTTRDGLSFNDASDSRVLGAFGISYRGIEDVTFWTGWSQGFVYPTMINLATGAFAGPDFVNPNPDLEIESSNSVDIGVRFSGERLQTELSAFHTWAEDYIDHVLCSDIGSQCVGISGDRDRTYINVDKARTFGLEFSTSLKLDPGTPYANITWLRRRFENNGMSTYDTGLPPFSGRFGVEKDHRLSPTVRGWADFYVRTASGADELGRRGVEHHGGWATVNLALGLNFGEKQQYRLITELLNLTDREYTPATENLIARGQSAIIRLVADF